MADPVWEIVEAAKAIERVRAGDRVTIYRDLNKSPSWSIQFNVDGTQFRKSLKTTSKKRALELAKKQDAELVLGIAETPVKRSATIAAAIDKYIPSLKARGRSVKTLALYERDLRQFQHHQAAQGLQKLKAVTADVLEAYERLLGSTGVTLAAAPDAGKRRRGRRAGKPNSPTTVRSKMKTIRQLIRFGVKREMINKEPAPGYYLPQQVKRKAFCWSPEELKKVLDRADAEVRPLLDFLRFTGLRSDELCWLMTDDVDLGMNAHVKIRHKTCRQTGRSWRPKHDNERTVPLCSEALAIARAASAGSPGPWLFYAPDTLSDQPGHWTGQRLLNRLQAAKTVAGVTRGTIHTFRHLYCSFLANRAKDKVTAFQVMKLMGHSSMDIVLTYFHCDDRELSAAIAAVDFGGMLHVAGKEGQT